jgi:hypothetical protein
MRLTNLNEKKERKKKYIHTYKLYYFNHHRYYHLSVCPTIKENLVFFEGDNHEEKKC